MAAVRVDLRGDRLPAGGRVADARPTPPSAAWPRSAVASTAAVLVALALIAFWVIRLGRAPDRRDGGHRQRHRRGRPVPPGRGGSRQHRGGPAGAGPQRDAAPDRGGVRAAPGLGEPAPPVRGRRVPRAAHAAHVDPGLHRALPVRRHRRGPGARRRHAPHRGRGRSDGRAGRGPAAAGPARSGPPARRRAGRSRRAGPRRGGRCPGRRARSSDRHRDARRRRWWWPATSVACARSWGTCWPTPVSTRRPTSPVDVRVRSGARVGRCSRWPTEGPGIAARGRRPRVRALLPRRSRPRPRRRRGRTGPVHRRRRGRVATTARRGSSPNLATVPASGWSCR